MVLPIAFTGSCPEMPRNVRRGRPCLANGPGYAPLGVLAFNARTSMSGHEVKP